MAKVQRTLFSLASDEVTGEAIEIRYIPLEIALKHLPSFTWKVNPKKGDIGAMTSAILKYGFQDPPKWDRQLNDGRGGLVYGNHRFIAVVQSMKELVRLGQPLPQGIPLAKSDGEWSGVAWDEGEPCIPVKFGVDSSSEEAAIAFALDHNALTLSGGDFGPLDITTRLYDPQPLAELLQQITPIEEAIVLDGDALDSLLGSLRSQDGSEDGGDPDNSKTGYFDQYPKAVVLDKAGEKLWQEVCSLLGVNKPTFVVERLMEHYLQHH